jgi:hypothetical protein
MMSPDQLEAYDGILDWSLSTTDRRDVTLAGYAGCGKTWLLSQIAQKWQRMRLSVCYVSPTGKASLVLREVLRRAGIEAETSTIHSRFLRPSEVKSKKGEIAWDTRDDCNVPALIVVDEASMLDAYVLRKVKERAPSSRFLFVGDHFQLPAVGESTGVMLHPTWRLETIHRQTAGSPILSFATAVREQSIPASLALARRLSEGVGHASSAPFALIDRVLNPKNAADAVRWTYEIDGDGLIVVGRNTNRVKANQLARAVLRPSGRADVMPEAGDVLVVEHTAPWANAVNGERFRPGEALTLIDYERVGLLKGTSSPVAMLDEHDRRAIKAYCDRIREAKQKAMRDRQSGVRPSLWADLATQVVCSYGWAVTCHKAQGSQARRVLVTTDDVIGTTDEDRRRWLYTAATRSQESLRLVRGLQTR